MDFKKMLQPVSKKSIFSMEGWFVWCGSMVADEDGKYYLLFSRWKEELGMNAWVTNSEIACAVSDNPLGPYEFLKVVLPGSGTGWDAHVTHNPTVIKADGKYYLYYMGTHGEGGWWDFRNNQRIGVAVADHPTGPWKRYGEPVIDVSQDGWDCLMTSNPSCTQGEDGTVYLLYKGVGAGAMPKGGKVLAGIAKAKHPLGPFEKFPEPIIENPENDWAVEDGFIWWQDGRYYILAKDFHGYFTKAGKNTVALFESEDAYHWELSSTPLAISRELIWEDGERQMVHWLERPQLWLDDGKPAVLFCACRPTETSGTFNVHIPLENF